MSNILREAPRLASRPLATLAALATWATYLLAIYLPGMACAAIGSPVVAAERQPWEIAPYRVLVWLDASAATASGEAAGANRLFYERLQKRLAAAQRATSGAVWQSAVEPAPVPLNRWLTETAETPDLAPWLEQRDIPADQWDRVILVSLSSRGAWHITFREFDTLTRSWGNRHSVEAPQTELLLPSLLRLVYSRFAPLARIDRVDDARVDLAPRAASLVNEEHAARHKRWNTAIEFAAPVETPVWDEAPSLVTASTEFPDTIPGQVTPADALVPVLRRNDRTGKLAANGILRMPWTYISQLHRDQLGLHGTLWSGYGQPLPGRRNIRTQRLALAVRPTQQTTRLRLVAKDAPEQPLAGYEVYAKGHSEAIPTQRVGTTDVEGQIEIGPADQGTVRLLYVRSGGNLLARLPLLPGLMPTLTASVTDDSPRLAAEGFVEGWRDQLVDTMARRQILTRRVRRKIDEGNLDEAERWLRELKSGRTVGELAFDLRAAKGEFLSGGELDPITKRRIDELFEKGQKLVAADRSLAVEAELTQALKEARKP